MGTMSSEESLRVLKEVPPQVATDLGYQLYLLDCAQRHEGNGGAAKTLKDRIERVIAEINAMLDDVVARADNHIAVKNYVTRINLAANNYAQGLASHTSGGLH